MSLVPLDMDAQHAGVRGWVKRITTNVVAGTTARESDSNRQSKQARARHFDLRAQPTWLISCGVFGGRRDAQFIGARCQQHSAPL
eukprot:6189912-Pleurochrysis_carterae.AAC.1